MKTLLQWMLVLMFGCVSLQTMAQISCTASFTFQANPNSTIVAFTNTSTTDTHGTTVEFMWNFGDGESSADSNATHAYVSPGVYNVCLYINTYYAGQVICTDSNCQQIAIGGSLCGNAQAAFIDTVNGSTVLLNSVSTGTNTSTLYQWWMDGQIIAYSSSNTAFAFSNAPVGTHNFCLYLYSGENTLCDSVCKSITITSPCSALNPGWTYNQQSTSDSIEFHCGTGQSGYNNLWTFGDGTYSEQANVIHGYAQTGTYTVCHIVSSTSLGCADTSCQTITVNNNTNCAGLTASWSDSMINYNTVQFKAVDTSSTHNKDWNFGDGNYGFGASASHTYTTPGTYHVCLYAYTNGCIDSSCANIQINPSGSCNANFTYYQNASDTPSIYFTNTSTSSDSIISYEWSFGGGVYSTSKNPIIRFNAYGTYIACLYIKTVGGCTSSRCDTINLPNPNPCSGLTAEWASYPYSNPDSVRFYSAQATSNDNHYWTFGDSTSSDQANPIHYYAHSGSYNVCLIVTVPGTTCADTSCKTVVVTAPPTCGTAALSYYIYGGNSIHAYSTSTGTDSTTTYTWHILGANGNLVQSQSGATSYIASEALPNGTYTVCLYLSISPQAVCDSTCSTVTINDTVNPCSTLTAAWRYTASDSSVSFKPADTSTNVYRIWSFGDGTSSTNFDPTHVYAQPGTYTVCLITRLAGSVCADTSCQSIVVSGVPHCGTAAWSDYIYGTNSIHAYSTSTNVDSTTVYAWYLWSANGNLVQSQSGHGTYIISQALANGTYDLCLYLYTSNGMLCDSSCKDVMIDSSNACSGLTANWTSSYLQNSNISFTPADTSSAAHHIWSFGDGTSSYVVNPIHAYADPGLYHVCLYIYIPGTTCADSFCANVQANASNCQAYFSYQSVYPPYNQLQFTNLSTAGDSITAYRWVFGDGTDGDFANGNHTYPHSGEWQTCLTISTANGCSSTYCDSVNVQYDACYGLTAQWSDTVLPNGNVHFRPIDINTTVHHIWTFGDGTSSTNFDPVHAYSQPGTYNVCLIVYIPGTNCVDTSCATIQIGASGCNANFSYISYYPPYDAVAFANLSTSGDSIISYAWNFGDNTTGTFVYGTHIFPHSGVWNVCLTITTAGGCTSTYCDSVNVLFDPCYGLNASWTYTYNQSGGVSFAGTTDASSVFNLWYFGDSTYSTQPDPTHYFTGPGEYNVCHLVGIEGSCADTSCQTIQGTGSGSGCHANFSFRDSVDKVYFSNTSTSTDSIVSYVWDFEDGSGSHDKNPTHQYATPGTYNVCLTITSASGCTNSYCDSIHVGENSYSNCQAAFTFTFDTCEVVAFTNTSTGGFTNQYYLFGDGSHADTSANPVHSFPVGTWTVTLTVWNTSAGCQSSYQQTITVNPCGNLGNDTVCGFVFNDLNGNGVQNDGEPGIPNAEVHVGDFVVHADSTGHYVAIVPAGSYNIYYCAPQGYTFSIPVNDIYDGNTVTCAVYQGVQVGAGSNCGYNFGIVVNSVTICGTVFFDANDNHVQDAGEAGIAGAQVTLTDSANIAFTVFTDQYGHYCAVVPEGTYVITVSSGTYSSGIITPQSITDTALANGQTYNNNNFGIYTSPGECNLSIKVTPNTTITPGFPAWYYIQVCNLGSNSANGTVNLFYDPNLTYNYSSPAATSQNSSAFVASWDLNNLLPGDCQYYWISLTADSNLTSGQPVFTLASVTTTGCDDIDMSNNIDTLHQTTTASWDPNNKTVTPIGQGPGGNIGGNQQLTYTLNFQNTGTAPAVNIVIHDTISPNLNLATFKMLGASFPYTMQITGRVAIWKFNDIMLPDSAVDQQGSHGFVSFAINPVQSLPQGTQITNTGYMFFDYNAGVGTNTTLNTIDYTLSVNEITAGNVTITLQPNPFNQLTTIKIEGADGPYELKAYDMMGKIIIDKLTGDNVINIDRGNLASGMYMYEILQKGSVIGKGKMIAQ